MVPSSTAASACAQWRAKDGEGTPSFMHRDEMADAVSEARTAVLFSPPRDAFPTLNDLHELLR